MRSSLAFIVICTLCVLAGTMDVCAEKISTNLTIGINPEDPSINDSFRIIGILTTADGKPLGNKRITLESSDKGADDTGGFAYIGIRVTERAGKYELFRPSNSPPEYIRAAFAGNDDFEPAISPVIAVRGAGTDHPQIQSGKTGSIMITTRPEGADVSVDDIFRGITPIKVAGLSEGSHMVNVTKQNYQNEIMEAYVTSDNDVSLNIALK